MADIKDVVMQWNYEGAFLGTVVRQKPDGTYAWWIPSSGGSLYFDMFLAVPFLETLTTLNTSSVVAERQETTLTELGHGLMLMHTILLTTALVQWF